MNNKIQSNVNLFMCKSWFSHFDYFGEFWNNKWLGESRRSRNGDKNGPDLHSKSCSPRHCHQGVLTPKDVVTSPHPQPPGLSLPSLTSYVLTTWPCSQSQAASSMCSTINIPSALLGARPSARWWGYTIEQDTLSRRWSAPCGHISQRVDSPQGPGQQVLLWD